MDPEKIIEALGGPASVATTCKVRVQAVYQWYGVDSDGKPRQIPPARLMFLEAKFPKVFRELAKESV